MDDSVTSNLAAEKVSPFHQQMLEDSKVLMKRSRDVMVKYYGKWDLADQVFRGIRPKDSEDIKARERKEPEKMVVPISYSQIQTFVAFCYSLFTQREKMFEVVGFEADDDKPAKVGEALLARDLRHNKFEALLQQFLLDIARFGLGVFKVCWTTDKQMVRETITTQPMSVFGVKLTNGRQIEQEVEKIKYQGNKIVHISPYRFFPDPRLPLVRFQEGEFCGSEDLYSMATLRQWEHEGKIAGVDFIKSFDRSEYEKVGGYRFDYDAENIGVMAPGATMVGSGQIKKTVVISEIQRVIVPADYEVDGKRLGTEKRPTKYNIWMANYNRIIKCEPLGYVHDDFTYCCAPFIFDDNTYLSDSLSDSIAVLQDVITWFINSRITNVRKVIQDKLVVHAKNIEMGDLEDRAPVIRMKSSAPADINKSIMQLALQDVTTNHIGDAKYLHEIVQTVTGINDALLGQFQPGRRPAAEHRNTSAGSASRLKTVAAVIYWVALEPLARQMLSNLRDGLEDETFVRLVGLKKAVEGQEFVSVTREDLVGNYDFEIFDGTLPSERSYTAQALEEILSGLMKNPEATVMFGLDPRKILFEIMELRGIRHPERFELDRAITNPLAASTGAANTNGEPVIQRGAGQPPVGTTNGDTGGY
jgi:hypothetical protein